MAPVVGKLKGLVAATFTPFKDHSPNLEMIEPYVNYLKDKQGVTNIFVNGTSGESVSLTVEERKVLAGQWCVSARGKMDQVIVQVGCMSLNDTQDLARHAMDIEASGIAVMSPSFFKPKTADALREYLYQVALVAPKLPFYYYHVPVMTGVEVNARDVLEGIEKRIPSFSGVKFCATDLMDFGQCVEMARPHGWSVLYAVDEQLVAALAMGAEGAVGSTYNYLGFHANKIISAFQDKDISGAREKQFKVQELLCFAIKHGFDLGVNKKLMSNVSRLELGHPRLPVLPCSHDVACAVTHEYHRLFH